jgi:transcriptional regulator with XRE-family HTH domain
MSIGEKIKARRQELGFSQRELAKRLGYTDHTTITRVEAGKVDLPMSRIAQFAEALRVSPSYIMGWDQEPEDLGALAAEVLRDPVMLQLVQEFRGLDAVDRATVSTLVSSLAQKKKG